QPSMPIGNSLLLRQQLFPGFLGVVENKRHKLHQWFFRFVARGVRPVNRRGDRRACAASQQGEKILLEDQAQDEQHHHAAQSDMHPSEAEASSAPSTIVLISAILDIVACPAWCPAHEKISSMKRFWKAVHSGGRIKILPSWFEGKPANQNLTRSPVNNRQNICNVPEAIY